MALMVNSEQKRMKLNPLIFWRPNSGHSNKKMSTYLGGALSIK